MNYTVSPLLLLKESLKNRAVLNVHLNRPNKLNAINFEMYKSLNLIETLADQAHLQTIIISGMPHANFSSGGDIKELYFSKRHPSAEYPANVLFDMPAQSYRMIPRLAELSQTKVALMDGITMGGGFSLGVFCDLRVVTERTKMAMQEIKFGFFPDDSASFYMTRMTHPNLGTYLALQARIMNGSDAIHCGFADYLVRSEKLPGLYEALESISLKEQSKENVRDVIESFAEKELSAFSFGREEEFVRNYYDNQDFEQLIENLQSREFDRAFQQQCLSELRSFSPSSVRVSHEAFKRGAHLSLRENARMTQRICREFALREDMFEGIHQLLIDRNYKPKWEFERYEDVGQEVIAEFFKRVPSEHEIQFD